MKLNGVFLLHKKGTENSETISIPVPKNVVISMSQNMGAFCEPLVKVGDKVLVGQKIGDSDKFMSCPVHSSVSGTVTAIKEILTAGGKVCKAVEIQTDGAQQKLEGLCPVTVTDKESLCKAARDSGCCGLGGAGFPTHIKLNYNESKTHVDTLVINAAECEPYITSDYRCIIEQSDDIYNAVKLIMSCLKIEKAVIGIEKNKPAAIKLLREKTQADENICVKVLESAYPQGAEKVIAFNTTGRIIKEGELPSDEGIIVLNVSTAAALYEYIKTGMPLVRRRLTIDGDIVATPCNVSAPIGTLTEDLLRFADCNIDAAEKILFGGPMMGMCIYDIKTPLCKTNNAILAFKKTSDEKLLKDNCTQTHCIRCARCIEACPIGLMPTELEKAYDNRDKQTLEKLRVNLCINCGSCTYVCPAKRNLAEKNQLAKAFLRT